MTRVTVCTWGNEADAGELLTFARRLGDGAELTWLVLGALPDAIGATAARFGAAAVAHINSPKLSSFAGDSHVEAIAQYCGRCSPAALIFAQTFDTRLIAPRVAGRLQAPIVMNVLEAETAGEAISVVASAYGGDARAAYTLAGGQPCILSVMPNVILPELVTSDALPASVKEVDIDLSPVTERIRVVDPARREGPRLEDAQVIVAGGRGLGKPENFALVEDLAGALGGFAAASRPIVDDGWTDPSRQVGLTGKITRAALYVAAGISGASQHMVGCSAAKTLVAINRDRDAPIFRYARFGAVGDCLEILPELTRILRDGKRES